MLKKLIGISVFAGASGLGVFFFDQINKLKETCISVTSFSISRAGVQNVYAKLGIKIVNKSQISVTLSNQSFDIYVNNVFIGNISNSQAVQLEKESSLVSQYDLQIDTQQALKLGLNALTNYVNTQNSSILIVRKVTAKTKFGISKRLKFNISGKLNEMMQQGGGEC